MGKLNSPIAGWSLTDVIHNHPFGRRTDAFSDVGNERFGGGDVQVASRGNFNLFLTVMNNDRWIGKFNPTIYKDVQNNPGSTRMDALNESINSRSIHIRFPTAIE